MPTDQLTKSPMINAILTAAIIGLISWTLLSVHNLAKTTAQIQTQVEEQSKLSEYIADHLEKRIDNVERLISKDL